MNYVNEDILSLERIRITNLLQEIGADTARTEIMEGLQRKDKYISSKFFYNKKGSELYTKITQLPEYYPARTEKKILEAMSPELMYRHRGYEIMELGPGDPSKISILLKAASGLNDEPVRYLPLDISRSAVENIASTLVKDFPGVLVEGYALDFMSQFDVLDRDRPLLVCFLGSTIGNLEYRDALELLAGIGSHLKDGDTFMLGMDLIKSEKVLYAAYNDASGVTAEFNLNILSSVNEMLLTDFDTGDFRHLAFFNEEFGRVEMHLEASRDVHVHSPYLESPLQITRGERIHTENSHKYSEAQIQEMAYSAGLSLVHSHMDEKKWFALSEFRK